MSSDEIELMKMAEKYFEGDINVAQIWRKKYTIINETPQDVWKRLARLTAEIETTETLQKKWEEKFYDILRDWIFVPGGRIMFGLTDNIKEKQRRKVVLSNCFYLPQPEDNLESIMDIAYKMSKVYSTGGGVGLDLSLLRPKGSKVNNSAIYSDGVVPFAELYSNVTNTISISGRRGALMLTLDINHKDILNFINAKRDLKKINHANISVKITDEFMNKVVENGDWELYFKVKDTGEEIKEIVKAKDIFDTIIRNNWESAEPGILFWDKILKYTPNAYFEESKIMGVNPCSEQPLPNWGNCNLGSINLTKFVRYGFIPKRAEFDWKYFEEVVHSSVRFLDNINELSIKYKLFPFPEQLDEVERTRRIGLGIMGLADMLIMLGIKFDSDEALVFCDELFKKMRNYTYNYSCELAKEKGTFKIWNYDKWEKSDFVKNFSPDIKDKVKKLGLRNLTLLSIAPTGSISILAGVSSGIEPIFALSYDRRIRLGDEGEEKIIKIYHPLYKKYLEKNYSDFDEKIWVMAHDVNYKFRVKLQGLCQKYICTAISSTVNIPANSTEETIQDIYLMAWKENLKGITIYRDTCRESVLLKKKKRPYELTGKTFQVKDDNNITYYITINSILEDLKLRPFEIFINSKETSEWIVLVSRLVSAIMRRTPDIEFVIKQLRKSTKKYNGLLYRIAEVLEGYIKKPVSVARQVAPTAIQKIIATKVEDKKVLGLEKCPVCGNMSLKNEAGCRTCTTPGCIFGSCPV